MKTSLIVALLAFGFSAFAEQETMDITQVSEASVDALLQANPAEMPASCIAANINDSQKMLVKDAVDTAKKEIMPLKADLKQSMQDYETTVKDTASNITVAQMAGLKIKDNFSKMADVKLNLANNIFYTILRPDQKSSAFDCLKDSAKASREEKLDKICQDRSGATTPAPTPTPVH